MNSVKPKGFIEYLMITYQSLLPGELFNFADFFTYIYVLKRQTVNRSKCKK